MGHYAQSFLQAVMPVLLEVVLLMLADDFGVTIVSAWTTCPRSTTTTIASHVHRFSKLSSLSKRRIIRRMRPPLQEEQHFFATTRSSNDGSSLGRDASDAREGKILDNRNDNNDDDNNDNNLPFVSSPIPISKTGNDGMQQENNDVAAIDLDLDLDYFLDPDLYTQSRKLLNADGSLRLESLSSRDDGRIVSEGYDSDQSQSQQPSFDADDTAGYTYDDGDSEWSNPEDAFLRSTVVGTIPTNDVAYRQMVESLFVPQQGQASNNNGHFNDDNDATMDDLWEAIRKQRRAMEAAASASLFKDGGETSHASRNRYKKAAAVGNNDDDDKAVDDDDNHSTTNGSDPVHEEIFAQEDGFFLQSHTFRESLIGNDREKAAKARSLRTGKAFRQRQEAAIQSLQEQMDDFEQNILPQLGSLPASSSSVSSSYSSRQQVATSASNKTAATGNAVVSNIPMVRCSQCGCILAKDEIDHWIRQRRRFQQQHQQGQTSSGNSGIDEIKRICRACHCDALVSQSNKRLAGRGDAYSTRTKISRDGRRNYGYPSPRMATPTTPSMLQTALWRRQAQQKQQQMSSPTFRPSPTEQWRRNEPKTKVQQQQPKESQTLTRRANPMKDDWDKNGKDDGEKL